MRGSVKDWIQRKKISLSVYIILVLIVIYVLIEQFFKENYENILLCALTLVLFLVPCFIEKKVSVMLPGALEILMILFVFGANILGEIYSFYLKFWYWDDILHVMSGFLGAAVGLSLIDILNYKERFSLTLSPIFVAVFAFCVAMTTGVIWEFFEFAMDQIFHSNMQKDTLIPRNPYIDIGLIDTMVDLIVNFVGATVGSVLAYFYVKKGGKGKFINSFIPQYVNRNIKKK